MLLRGGSAWHGVVHAHICPAVLNVTDSTICSVSAVARNLIEQLLVFDPACRITAAEVPVSSPFVAKVT